MAMPGKIYGGENGEFHLMKSHLNGATFESIIVWNCFRYVLSTYACMSKLTYRKWIAEYICTRNTDTYVYE